MTKTEQHSEKVALFRFTVISSLLPETAGTPEYRLELRRLIEKSWEIPGTNRTRVAPQTIRDWLRRYRTGECLDSLRPKLRQDSGKRRLLSVAATETLLRVKRQQPKLSVRQAIDRARQTEGMPQGERLPHTTVYRLFRDEGLMKPAPQTPPDRRKFSYRYAGELWMSNVLHGPKVPDGRQRKRKTYLLALLDDATRVIPYAEFAFGEKTVNFLPVLNTALAQRGIPERL